MSILVHYANFYVKNLRKNNDKMTQFHWSRKSRDSCPTSSEVKYIIVNGNQSINQPTNQSIDQYVFSTTPKLKSYNADFILI